MSTHRYSEEELFGSEFEEISYGGQSGRRREVWIRRAPSPGIAAVLSVLLPGLGQIYNGRLAAGLFWFLAVGFGYWAILVPGFLLHCICVWTAYTGARTPV